MMARYSIWMNEGSSPDAAPAPAAGSGFDSIGEAGDNGQSLDDDAARTAAETGL